MSKRLGTVVSIHTTATAGAAMDSVASALAVPGRGLEGDRHFEPQTNPARQRGAGCDVTLIEEEAVEAVCRDYKVALQPNETRRNVVTRGIALNHLIGRKFVVGEVKLAGVELCEPCGHLAQLTSKTVSRALVHRGGLRCDVLTEGTIHVSDVVTAV